jgi:hypothetical protein
MNEHAALLPVMQPPCCHGAARRFPPGALNVDTTTRPWSSRLSSSRVSPFRERLAGSPARPGRGCYRVLRTGTVTVAQ